MPEASRLSIQLFGAFDATIDGVTPPGIWLRSAAQLLALLACRHGTACHDVWVADMLWPETGSLDSLRASIAALRRALGPEARRIETVNGTVRLHTKGVDIDVVRFDHASAAGDEASLRLAVRLYGPGLLEMWTDGWVEAERETRREAYIDALRALATGATERSDHGLAAKCYRRLVRARPMEETAWLGLFTSLVQMGERLEAVRIYDLYRDRLSAHHLAPPAAVSVQYRALIAAPLGPAPELSRDFLGFEPAGGAVPLASPYYIERAADSVCHAAVERMDSFVLVRGPRQIGKTSLVARALDRARRAGARIVLTDLQKLPAADLESAGELMRAVAGSLADQLGLESPATDGWQNGRSPGANLERFVLLHAMGSDPAPLVWAIDEADRLFGLAFRADLFGLLRSWHNARALDPTAPWIRLCVILAHATEAALFIPDAHQSPFNVGTHVVLGDVPRPEVEELNRRYGSPLSVPDGLDALMDLVGGHPYLLRRALHALVTTRTTVDVLAGEARADGGVFSDHLDSLLVALKHDADMTEAVRSLIGGATVDARAFARLRAAGVVLGETPETGRIRCRLYRDFLLGNLARPRGG